jgi:hypothetical protein
METLGQQAAGELKMNDIGAVQFESTSPLFFDTYQRNRIMGRFIVIDPISNATVGAAMIERDLSASTSASPQRQAVAAPLADTIALPAARYSRHGHYPGIIVVQNRAALAPHLEQALFAAGFEALHIHIDDLPAGQQEPLLSSLLSLGAVVILSTQTVTAANMATWRSLAPAGYFDFAGVELPTGDAEAVAAILRQADSLRITPRTDGAQEPV